MGSSQWYERQQGLTTVTADQHRETWTVEDLEFVQAFTAEVSDCELAITLGRTLHAIQDVQWAIKQGRYDDMHARAVRRATPVVEPQGWDFVTTFPPGWFD